MVYTPVAKYARRMPPPPVDPPEPDPDCLFCRIVSGEVTAEVLHREDSVVAFGDISPQAPTHFLVVPAAHCADAASLSTQQPGALDALVRVADTLVRARGVESYRLVFNTGPDAGQTVFHAHLHVLGGRPMSWPPG